MRTQTYIFLQKLRCPKCGRILAGGATHKIKYDKWYFYYRKYVVLNLSGLDYHYIKVLEPLRVVLYSYGMAYQYIPVVSLTTSIGLTTWAYLYLTIIIFRNKKNKYVLMLIPAFLTILMCVVGPINTYYRYVIPYSMSLPFILCIIYNEIKNKINK